MHRVKESCETTARLVRGVIADLGILAAELENMPINNAVDLVLGQTTLLSNATALELKKQQIVRQTADIEIICSLLRNVAQDMNNELPNALAREAVNNH